jgi:RNase P/RNase MRP subunit POP5
MPTLKDKKRYLAFEIMSKSKIESYNNSFEAIQGSFSQLYGMEGLGKAGIMPVEGCWNREKQVGLLRVNNKYLNELRSSLTMIKSIKDEKVIVRSIFASGIIKKAKLHLA